VEGSIERWEWDDNDAGFKEVDQLNIDLEPGAIDVVKGEQANERD
jgi:hypothetical protein